MPDLVDERDQLAQAVRAVSIPGADLVFLRVEIFLRPRFLRAAFAELEGGAVDAVVGAQRSGQEEPRGERGASTRLQVLREDVRGVGPQVGPEVLADRWLGQLAEVLRQLSRSVAPREARVRLREPVLGQPDHY